MKPPLMTGPPCLRTWMRIYDGTSEYLFGDLSKLAKEITEANKLTKKVRPQHSGTCWALNIWLEPAQIPALL